MIFIKKISKYYFLPQFIQLNIRSITKYPAALAKNFSVANITAINVVSANTTLANAAVIISAVNL